MHAFVVFLLAVVAILLFAGVAIFFTRDRSEDDRPAHVEGGRPFVDSDWQPRS